MMAVAMVDLPELFMKTLFIPNETNRSITFPAYAKPSLDPDHMRRYLTQMLFDVCRKQKSDTQEQESTTTTTRPSTDAAAHVQQNGSLLVGINDFE
ncbi:unnamed protein product [Adineta steineri]|uniref:Uncharacterized protein n=1 Tax=Adineta steineri TaxID=433720 RepID=A0A819RCW4_9BILA|nr:unnamed protein product [Adineta steineri]CAF4045298.1 unnamed protein product [Adineta steineri]